MEIRKFSDFAKDELRLDGKKIRIDDILNKNIIILGYRLSDSHYSKNKSGKYATVQFEYENEKNKNIFFSGSDIIIDELKKYEPNIPFETKVIKINRYYTFS